ncbi:MAG: nicotinamide riboside transporter PnuC [Flavobacteriaceae bacterium]|jgi:nicotinamide mononucleotide transporter
MSQIFDCLFGQYADYAFWDVTLEIVAATLGLISVWCAKKNHVAVFPTGMISTAIYVYLLFQWSLLGDMMINGYYFLMSVYGWYVWTRRNDHHQPTPITQMSRKEVRWLFLILIVSLVFVYAIYVWFDKWGTVAATIDTLTTAIFFGGMWLMARRKIENWIFWIVGDVISVPLYITKGLTFTSFQYLIFTFVAVFGYIAWKKALHKSITTA